MLEAPAATVTYAFSEPTELVGALTATLYPLAVSANVPNSRSLPFLSFKEIPAFSRASAVVIV